METTLMLVLTAGSGLAGALALAFSTARKQIVKTDRAPLPIGPYSQAVAHGNLVFVSGQLGINLETKKLENTVQAQTATALTHLMTVLEAAGSGMDCVLKTTIFLADMNDFPVVNEVYGRFFGPEPPARSTVQVARLPLSGLVEIEAVAYVK
jgi:2-iminobutanoate/2-iminopropanoate deaminase